MRYFLLTSICAASFGFYAIDAKAQDAMPARTVSVQSIALMDVGPWGASALPDGLSALPSDLWRGADGATLAEALGRINPDQRFPSMQILVRQALFSGGLAPSSDPDLARLRFDAASRFGPADAAARLVFGVPRLAADTGLAAIAIDAALRVGQTQEACALIEAVPVPAQGTTWLEARATCYALNDEPDAANLSVDLAKSRGLTDTWLSRAIASVSGPISSPPPFRADSGRAIALSLRTKLIPPPTLASLNNPAAVSALVQNKAFLDTLASEEQQALLKNGAVRGVVPVAGLASPYAMPQALPLVVEAVAPAPVLANGEAVTIPPPEAPPPPVSTQIVQNILAAPTLAARAIEARIAIAALQKQLEVQPGRIAANEVPVLVEAALWAGQGALASQLAALLPTPLDPRLALVVTLYDPAMQSQAVVARIDSASADPIARRLAMRDAMVAWSAGLPMTGGTSYLVQAGLPWGPGSNGGLRAALELASQRGSKAEVALLAALATQSVDPVNLDGETAITIIRALRRVGLSDAARDLARDYILAGYVTLAPARPTPRVRPAVAAPAAALARAPTPRAPTQAAAPPTQTTAPPPAAVTPPPARRPAAAPATTQSPRAAPLNRASPNARPATKAVPKPTWGN